MQLLETLIAVDRSYLAVAIIFCVLACAAGWISYSWMYLSVTRHADRAPSESTPTAASTGGDTTT